MPIKYLTPTLDTWIDEDNPAATHPTDTTLRVFQDNAGAKSTVALLTWDVVGEIPATATIVDAYFRFWWQDFDGDVSSWFEISRVTSAWNAAVDWNNIPTTASSPVTQFRKASLGLDDDVMTVIGYDYIRETALRSAGGPATPDDPRALFLLVKGWHDTSIANHGVMINWRTVAPAGDTFYKLYSVDDADIFHRPFLVIEYVTADDLPATFTEEQGGFYGAALDLLERELIPLPNLHLYVEYPDGTEVDLIDDWIGATGLQRNIPFLFEKLELPPGSFLLKNVAGQYSETNRDSDFYGGALIGAFLRAVVEIEGQEKVLYRGEIRQIRDSTDDTAELLCASYFNRFLNYELTTPRSITAYGDHWNGAPPSEFTAFIADIIYDAFHNYAGLPEADMNINRFADVLDTHTTQIISGAQIWVKDKLSERVRDLCDVGRCQPYQDQNGDLALHFWEPDDPDTDDEVNADGFEWYEQRDEIINQLEINWKYEYPEEIGRDPAGEETVYTDTESADDPNIGLQPKTVSSTAFRIPAMASLMGEFYTRVLGFPHKRGTLRGGAEFLRYDLGSVFWLRNDAKGIYTKVRVIGYDPKPGFDGAWSITMDVIPTNWTLPYRTYTLPGAPLISFNNDLAAPTPSAIAFNSESNGELTITINWTYEPDLVPPDGFVIYWNSGATAGQAVPTRESHTGKAIFPNFPWFRQFFFRVPDSHFVTIAISALAVTRRGFFESALVSSAAAPDWVDANYSGSVVADNTPTNVPAGLTAVATSEDPGTATVKLTWTYVQGAIKAEMFAIIGNFGTAGAPAAPVLGSEDWDVLLPVESRDYTITFEKQTMFGTFKIAAIRTTDQGWAYTVFQADANWTDIQPETDVTIGDDVWIGNDQDIDSKNLRDRVANQAPSNDPVADAITLTEEADGSGRITVGWTYTQGVLPADGVLLLATLNDGAGLAAPTTTVFDYSAQVAADDDTFEVTGFASTKYFYFGIVAYRDTLAGRQFGSVITSAGAPDWQNVRAAATITLDDNVEIDGVTVLATKDLAADSFQKSTDDLDDISDGAVNGKVTLVSLTAGDVDLAKAVGDLGDIGDGGGFSKVLTTDVTAGRVDVIADATAPASGTLTKEMVIPACQFNTSDPAVTWIYNTGGSFIRPKVANTFLIICASVVLPVGVTITTVEHRAYRDAAHDSVISRFYRVSEDAVPTLLATLTHDAFAAWQTKESAGLAELTAGNVYTFETTMRGVDTGLDALLSRVIVNYTMPDFGKGL